jgi:hypothetical protein
LAAFALTITVKAEAGTDLEPAPGAEESQQRR